MSIEQLQVTDLKKTTYNLEVEADHNYFVGNDLIWVHNAGCGMLGKQATQDLDASIANSLEDAGWTIKNGGGRAKQEAIKIPGIAKTGKRGRQPGTRFAGITAQKGDLTMRVQTVTVGAKGLPIVEEQEALLDILHRYPNDLLFWFPKGLKW